MGRLFNGSASFSAFAACLLALHTARADALPPPDWVSSQVNEGGQHCVPLAEHRQADKLLLACGVAGVWEFALGEAAPRFVRSYSFAGEAVGFIAEPSGRLWVKLQVLEAHPLSIAGTPGAAAFPELAPSSLTATSPSAPAVATPPVPAPPRPQNGRVTRTAPGEVWISLGTLAGVSPGDNIELAVASESPGDSGSEEAELSGEVVAVGVVTNAGVGAARVRLGLNESVPEAALARPTRAPASSSLSAPPRVSGLWELELSLRPFVAMDELGGGVLLSGSFGHRFGHLHLQGVVDPLAFAAVKTKRSVGTANAAAIASYDSQYFEVGLGFGAQTVNESGFSVSPGSGLSVVQLVRFGARDGLNFSARTSVVLFHSQFQFGGMVAGAQIPVTRGYWLLLNGGGGNVGYGYGEVGLRALLAGNGLAGSKYLTVTAGGVGVFRSSTCDAFFSCTDRASYGGPMVGVGGEWRF